MPVARLIGKWKEAPQDSILSFWRSYSSVALPTRFHIQMLEMAVNGFKSASCSLGIGASLGAIDRCNSFDSVSRFGGGRPLPLASSKCHLHTIAQLHSRFARRRPYRLENYCVRLCWQSIYGHLRPFYQGWSQWL